MCYVIFKSREESIVLFRSLFKSLTACCRVIGKEEHIIGILKKNGFLF